ncbi:ROK family protein [Companilactobacillus suantsaicola]|uniref:ROK family protein n=1 Tax=Companilactobacillus suantsaicola TaxID=2487723 RepID=A0A4Z0JKG2_9LACO|nr:ROK family protein [Companilactobacillus suantsaicola]TGD23551.1 ROK family protein [Companilactobacillus suantsaicola]
MKDIALIDVGGTSIKYGLWNSAQNELTEKGSFETPKDLTGYYAGLEKVVNDFKKEHELSGVAMSTPGAVNKETGVIEGASALPYIHNFKIQQELEKRFALPVTMENDANCAALAEMDSGIAKGLKNLIFLVIGTGVGGAVILDGHVHHGKHLFGGEFGYTLSQDGYKTVSDVSTAVSLAKRYNEAKQTNYSGKEVFDLANNGDELAQKYAQDLYHNLAVTIYNLQYGFDPEMIVLGGGISQADFLIPNIEKEIQKILDEVKIAPFMPVIKSCQYHNDANLIGAYVDFKQSN